MVAAIDTHPKPRALSNIRLADQVFDRLLELIITGRYMPGERLNVDEIAAELGTSRTPVREGLAQLSGALFVTVSRNSSTQVADWNVTDMTDRLTLVAQMLHPLLQHPDMHLPALAAAAAPLPRLYPDENPPRDVHSFLAILAVLADDTSSRVLSKALTEQIRPLQIFLTSDTLTQHGLSLTIGSGARHETLTAAIAAASRDDRDSTSHTLTGYTTQLIAALTKPGNDATPTR